MSDVMKRAEVTLVWPEKESAAFEMGLLKWGPKDWSETIIYENEKTGHKIRRVFKMRGGQITKIKRDKKDRIQVTFEGDVYVSSEEPYKE